MITMMIIVGDTAVIANRMILRSSQNLATSRWRRRLINCQRDFLYRRGGRCAGRSVGVGTDIDDLAGCGVEEDP